jgi:UDP-3-O-[3-hydroxymyristoyl] glucosamine N-acyltransferase
MPEGMNQPTFFVAKGPFALEALAEASGAEIRQAGTNHSQISGVATLDEASPGEITFLTIPAIWTSWSRRERLLY